MRVETPWRRALRELLEREGEPDRQLLDLVRQLDLPDEDDQENLPSQALARAVVAAGPALLARQPLPTVEATLAAGAAYVAAPSEATWAALFEASTMSYPFGPGEGCYSTWADGGCAPGSGCRSGAGTLSSIASEVGAAVVLTAVRAALLPWLAALEDR
jgi:hypothetical protein